MKPNKDWMNLVGDRLNKSYLIGVENFLTYAFKRNKDKPEIRCPCIICLNSESGTLEVVRSHLIVHGICTSYTFWYHHGEKSVEVESDEEFEEVGDEENEPDSDDELQPILEDLYPIFSAFDEDGVDNCSLSNELIEIEANKDAKKFYRLLKDNKKPLFPGSKISKLGAIAKFLHLKSIGKWTNKSFTMLLQFLNDDLLPDGSTLPNSYNEARKVIQDLGLNYVKYDACLNDCMLYWKADKDSEVCKVCGTSRWKVDKDFKVQYKANGKKIPVKTLRYFPLKPRLQRLFMSSKTASSMIWHHEKRVDDGVMRHPADSEAWKFVDKLYPSFAAEPRNVRLGLTSDGFQPFSNSRRPYSIWPVVLIPYNLEPWLCMKPSNFILSMIIPGPEGPGDAIDVYLQPLVDELKELWETGIETFDASTGHNFQLYAILLWTISDLPGLGILFGYSTKGKLACPVCNKDTCSTRLANGGKQCL